MEKVKDAWLTARDALTCTRQKAQESSLLDVQHVTFPLACYFGGTVLAWFMIPKLLQRCHQYGLQGPFNLLSESLSRMQLPYEKSFWGSLQDPVRYLITFVAFAKIGTMVAPTTIASQYLAQAWRIAAILSSVWFVYQWKTNALTSQSLVGRDLQKMLILDKVSSVGQIVVGLMALALACDVAVHSILFVGGIGGPPTCQSLEFLGSMIEGQRLSFVATYSGGYCVTRTGLQKRFLERAVWREEFWKLIEKE